MTDRIAFQGEPGAYSHQACREAYPDLDPLACRTFEDAIEHCPGDQIDQQLSCYIGVNTIPATFDVNFSAAGNVGMQR